MKLDQIPDTGKCIVAHPDSEPYAKLAADAEGIDYRLDSDVPDGHIYLLDFDALNAAIANVELEFTVDLYAPNR